MRTIYTLLFIAFGFIGLQAQTVEELKSMKAEKSAAAAELQAQANALKGEASALQQKIELASGWRKGLSGIVGFNLSNSDGWVANPNPNATSQALNLGLTAIANLSKTKSFWNNKLIISKAWQDVDLKTANEPNDDLFDNGTVDIFNISSLGGYKVTPKLAISGLGEVNTSLGNFFKPGTVDIGAGVTWLPITNMTVVIHPLNYNIKFPADNQGIETTGAVGAKLRVDYSRDLDVLGKRFAWSTTLSSFIPYSEDKQNLLVDTPDAYEAGSFEYTWLNSISFELWRGIGVGVSFGFREAKLEANKLQSFSSLGLSYGF